MLFDNHATGQRIKELRIKKGLSQQQLAIKCGYKGKSSITHIEAGSRSCLPRIHVLAEELDTTPPELLGFLDSDLVIEKIHKMSTEELKNLLKYLRRFMSEKSGETAK